MAIILDIDAEKRLLTIQQRINAGLEQRVRDEMAAREAAQQRAAHAERMHALGQIAGGIAHDFNNVLQAVTGGATLIERRPEDRDRVLRNVRMVLDAARRGAAITSRLLAFSRRGDLRAETVDAAALLIDMAEVLTHTLGGSVVCMVDVPPGLPPLLADRGQLETVLVNLATNARDAMPSGGTLTLAAEREVVPAGPPHPFGLAPGAYVRIVVSDTGTGMDATVLARVTEPFFTTKEPGKGTGLGLAMAKGFAEQSGGSLSIESTVGQGTRIILWLPGATASAAVVPAIGNAAADGPDKPCVLLVDDDAIVRDVLVLSLEESGYAVLAADSGAAALDRLASHPRVDIIVSDLTMPAMDGLHLDPDSAGAETRPARRAADRVRRRWRGACSRWRDQRSVLAAAQTCIGRPACRSDQRAPGVQQAARQHLRPVSRARFRAPSLPHTTASARSFSTSAALRPSHPVSTSPVCCPSTGDGRTLGGLPSTRTGQAGILNGRASDAASPA